MMEALHVIEPSHSTVQQEGYLEAIVATFDDTNDPSVYGVTATCHLVCPPVLVVPSNLSYALVAASHKASKSSVSSSHF